MCAQADCGLHHAAVSVLRGQARTSVAGVGDAGGTGHRGGGVARGRVVHALVTVGERGAHGEGEGVWDERP